MAIEPIEDVTSIQVTKRFKKWIKDQKEGGESYEQTLARKLGIKKK